MRNKKSKPNLSLEDWINSLNQPLKLIRFRMTRSWFYEKRINWNKSRKNIIKIKTGLATDTSVYYG